MENVWDHPRPPAAVPCERRVRVVLGRVVERDAWHHPEPAPAYAALAGHVSFHPGRMDAAWLGAERVRAQPGDFYGGWITGDLRGPFNGGAGTAGW